MITLCARRCGRETSRILWPAFVTSFATTKGSNKYFITQTFICESEEEKQK